MDIFIARQPIFDRKNKIFGYELLFRQTSNNYFIEMDDDAATSELIYNSFTVFGIDDLIDGTKAFINCSKSIIESDFLKLLPKDKIILEILEREKATQATMDACEKFKALGYKLALDDFVPAADNLPLLNYADILKIEFTSVSLDTQMSLIKKYKNKVKFLAEKLETREDYEKAFQLGYDLFQGYYFSKPSMLTSKDIRFINTNILGIIEELNTPEPSYYKITEIIEADLGLSYKLLKLVNSAYIAPRYKVKSIQQALTFLGTYEMYQWISLMMLKDMQDTENAELIKQSLIRGKLMSALGRESNSSEYFFTGIFSLIDIILNRDINDILAGLPLSEKVKHALLGSKNELRLLLDYIINFEKAEWFKMDSQPEINSIGPERFMELYVDSVKWAQSVKSL
jgi:c-di-GMP-related signal transduction protein